MYSGRSVPTFRGNLAAAYSRQKIELQQTPEGVTCRSDILNVFFSFQPKARSMLNTYVYYLLDPTCFGVCYTIFSQTIALFVQEVYVLCSVVAQLVL